VRDLGQFPTDKVPDDLQKLSGNQKGRRSALSWWSNPLG
jgi:hypothetical protein